MAPGAEGATRRVRAAALLLVAGLLAAPAGEHLYWVLGGTWGLHGQPSSTGIRIVAAVVVMLLVAAALVVLARVGLWRQTLVPDRMIRALTWGLVVFFLGHALVSVAESLAGMEVEWWLYGPGGLVLGLLALAVAASGGGSSPANRVASDGLLHLQPRRTGERGAAG